MLTDSPADNMVRDAIFSSCRTYRYTLVRAWDECRPRVAFIGLNPSTANETKDDPTIRRCIGFAKKFDFGSLTMLNLFAYRTPDPKVLYHSVDAAGLERPAWPGEVIEVPTHATVTIRIDMHVPEHDWQGHANRIDTLELIMIGPEGKAQIIASEPPRRQNPAWTQTLKVLPGGMVLRVRGRRIVDPGADLMFYTNPIRIQAGD